MCISRYDDCADGCTHAELDIQSCLLRQALQGTAAMPHLRQHHHASCTVYHIDPCLPRPLQMGNPGADVHGGFVLQLKWRRSGKPDVDVTSATAADLKNLYISRDDANVNAPNTGPWTVRANCTVLLPRGEEPASHRVPASICCCITSPCGICKHGSKCRWWSVYDC